jgi:predicted MFS family arabinose efflux permease
MVGREHLLSGVAMTSSIRFATMSIGKPVGGFILLTLGAAAGFFVNALAFLPLILALLTVIRVTQREITQQRRAFEDFKQGLRHVALDRSILGTICIATAPAVFVGNGFDPYLAIYADTVFDMGAEGYTYLITAVGVGALAGVLALAWAGNIRWKGKLLFVGVFGFCISMVAFAFSRSFALSLCHPQLVGHRCAPGKCSIGYARASDGHFQLRPARAQSREWTFLHRGQQIGRFGNRDRVCK